MPNLLDQLAAGREFTALRTVLRCRDDAAVLREGAAPVAGTGPAWIVYLCLAHADEFPHWPGVRTHADTGSMTCGSLVDFRPPEQLLQSHADLWLMPLTGVDPTAHDGDWSTVLTEARHALRARAERDAAGVESPLRGALVMLYLARRSADEGDLPPSRWATARQSLSTGSTSPTKHSRLIRAEG